MVLSVIGPTAVRSVRLDASDLAARRTASTNVVASRVLIAYRLMDQARLGVATSTEILLDATVLVDPAFGAALKDASVATGQVVRTELRGIGPVVRVARPSFLEGGLPYQRQAMATRASAPDGTYALEARLHGD